MIGLNVWIVISASSWQEVNRGSVAHNRSYVKRFFHHYWGEGSKYGQGKCLGQGGEPPKDTVEGRNRGHSTTTETGKSGRGDSHL
jgi:hypothetical protein